MPAPQKPSYRIIIPLLNAQKFLPDLLRVLSSISEDTVRKTLFIDSSSTDHTLAILRAAGAQHVHVIARKNFDHGGTRSMAAKLCDEDIVIFLTQDALPTDADSIHRLLLAMDDKDVAAAYGRQLPYPDCDIFGTHLRSYNYPDQPYLRSYADRATHGIKTAFLSNSFAAYRRSSMEQIGWFKNNLVLGEDMVAGAMLLKAGYKLAYASTATVWHSHKYTLTEEFRRYFDIGVMHSSESWILSEFGRPEGEGWCYLRSAISYLRQHRQSKLIPSLLLRTLFKLMGYKLGARYRMLPRSLIIRASMHPDWWQNQ